MIYHLSQCNNFFLSYLLLTCVLNLDNSLCFLVCKNLRFKNYLPMSDGCKKMLKMQLSCFLWLKNKIPTFILMNIGFGSVSSWKSWQFWVVKNIPFWHWNSLLQLFSLCYACFQNGWGTIFLVRWCFQRTLVPSFFFLSSFYLPFLYLA